jgi:arylsulfatase A-like enzyme
MRHLPLTRRLPFISLLLVAGCGCPADAPPTAGPPADGHRGALTRLSLAPSGTWRTLTSVARLTPTREGSGWEAQARFHQVLSVPEDVDPDLPLALYAYGPGTRMIKVPGPFDPTTFDRILISFLTAQTAQLRIILRRAGQPVLASAEFQVQGSNAIRSLVFPMAMLHGLEEPFDDLLLRVTGPGHAALVAVELQQQPAEGWLPHPDGGPHPVAVDGESREALGLGPHGVLGGRARHVPGAVFTFACAVPPEVPGGSAISILRLRLEDDQGGLAEHHFPLRSGQPWAAKEIALAHAPGGAEFSYTFIWDAAPDGPGACAITPPVLVRKREDVPTVVLITSDTHRADHLGLAGRGVDVRTPQLDALTRRGLFFEDCYASTNVTNPSHVALLTGTHPRDTGILDNITPLAAAAPTLAEAFRAAGFTTSMTVSATQLAPAHSGLAQGFDRAAFPNEADRDGAATLASLEPWWEETRGQPLFLWVHLFDAHAPYEVPASDLTAYYPKDRDPYDESLPKPPSHMRPAWDREIRDLEHLDARYRAEVTYLDGLLGGLLTRPRVAAGWLAFTADHGESLGLHDVYWDHRELYPDTLSVPLILAGPGVPAQERRSASVSQRDLGRTLLDLAGLTDVPFPGRSLLDGPRPGPRFALSANATSASVAMDGWFLVLHLLEHTIHADLPSLPRHRVELFHLTEDPDCLADLVREDLERARALRGILVNWLLAPRDTDWARSEEVLETGHLEDMAGLGYAEGMVAASDWLDPDCSCAWCSRFRP